MNGFLLGLFNKCSMGCECILVIISAAAAARPAAGWKGVAGSLLSTVVHGVSSCHLPEKKSLAEAPHSPGGLCQALEPSAQAELHCALTISLGSEGLCILPLQQRPLLVDVSPILQRRGTCGCGGGQTPYMVWYCVYLV